MSATKVLVPQTVWQQLFCYVNSATTEVSGFGTCRQVGPNLLIGEVFLLPQEATSVSTKIGAETLALFIDKFVRQGGDPKELVLQWHSHGRLPVYWSKTDNANIEKLLATGSWFVSLVFNKAGDFLCRVDIREPVRASFKVDIGIMPTPPDRKTERHYKDEVKTKVTVLPESDEGESG